LKLRVYIDTSVIGGCWDDEFAVESRALFDMARHGELTLLLSELLTKELTLAPSEVRAVLADVPHECVEEVSLSPEAERLRDAYLEAGILGPTSAEDAHHVALATVAKADLIVSWNFKHIVHVDRIRLFGAVNLAHGYEVIDIRSPLEVV
jgi:predicted nucleic acid-binding protein